MEVTEDIPKPERDARLYRRITFPNGLEALLISDPSLVRALPIPTLPRVMIKIQPSAAAGRPPALRRRLCFTALKSSASSSLKGSP